MPYIAYPVLLIADVLEEFGYDRDTPPGENLREWHRGYIGRPSQRKMSNSDGSVKQTDRPQHGREAEGAQSSFCNIDKSASASLKG